MRRFLLTVLLFCPLIVYSEDERREITLDEANLYVVTKEAAIEALKDPKIYTLVIKTEVKELAGYTVAHLAVESHREAALKALEDSQILLLKDSQGKTVKQVIEDKWGIRP
ncbi:MAG: hypothetical protein N2746_00720 [Deltaproteobacteria bacterium]|nr:hypothetical protein [Deltaproteobacteria bacterium]